MECILHHPVTFATVSPFSRQIPRFLLLIMETWGREKKRRNNIKKKKFENKQGGEGGRGEIKGGKRKKV